VKDFFEYRESLVEASINDKTAGKVMKNKDFTKLMKVIEKEGGARSYPSDEGMRDYVYKVLKKAGIKKPSQLKFIDDLGLSSKVRENKKWTKEFYNASNDSEIGSDISELSNLLPIDTHGGFYVFAACLASIYDEDDMEEWFLGGKYDI
jgi:hypothetical protein